MTLDRGHGRIERRTLTVRSELKENSPDFSFPGHQQVFRLERRTSHLAGSHPRTEVFYGLTSLSPEKASPERLLSLVRGHWGIESLHWIREVVFGEDKSPTRKGSATVFITLLRNVAIALLRLSGRKKIAESLRYFSWTPSRALSLDSDHGPENLSFPWLLTERQRSTGASFSGARIRKALILGIIC